MTQYLSQGSSGPEVKNLQVLLNFHLNGTGGAPLVPDGIFGSKTRAAVVKFQQLNRIAVDGIVGPQTRSVLLSARSVAAQVGMTPYVEQEGLGLGHVVNHASARKGAVLAQFRASPLILADNASPPVTQTQPPTVVETTVVVQTGQQVNINPWFFSPFVFTVQGNILIKQDGRAPFVISPGLQLFQNQVGSPSGAWSGQAFIQMGPTSLFTPGNFDLLNPFVQAFVQLNSGAPAGAGFAIGNQAQYNLLGNKLSLFINTQVVSSTDLSTGQTAAPSVQILGGVGIDVFQLFRKN